ncbi:GntR family transcriptional regulator [Rhodococcus sp. Leaf7]|uniref:GntR family transcriptional regulator n=1 Tax=unclassified Rhodococcus (in: high G+C Gram-positive bacteria) TaxID=192944 RepID=UPI0005AD03DC|nr:MULTISPECIES: GntR family transcriptional regulator [unclassified Rhodococcus (in: high G+C Gram-positive bacteria)]KIQ15168.1 GntR family transcriptional regulator [Rhodococcus sp. MEB064]KQU04675.1 GntR family transcriptional regulator [Rhodococcus sp. Leaf7]KQU40861.1 GntR family transcriptional regulator [Rhodococcus sp. Leaf247]
MMPVHLRDSAVPKHEQLRTILLHRCTKELQPGDLMPSERRLMEDYGVSRITVREAIGQLVNEGHVVRVRGKGTFVASRPVQSRLHLASFSEEMRAQGLEPTTVVLFARLEDPSAATARALNLSDGGKAYHIKRLRLADGEPVSVDDGWFDPTVLPGLVDLDLSRSIYDAMSSHYDVTIDRAEQTVSAMAADNDTATLLGTKRGAPVLYFDRVSFGGERPVEHTESWYRCDRYQLTMEVQGGRRPQRR